MNILKPSELKSIEQFFQLKQENLLKIMDRYLTSKYDVVYTTPHYIVAVGDIPIGIVAHLDTVFSIPPADIFYDRVKNVMWSPDGLGADDRAGVYSIVQLIKRGLRPTVIFTTDEETGGVGALSLIKDFPDGIDGLKYIIELDRRGCVDCVFYDCNNKVFEDYVEDFGFVKAFGTFSDISIICPSWGVAGVNLSIGYVDEHSYSELLYVGNMLATINKVEKMLLDADTVEEPFEYIPMYYGYGHGENDCYGWNSSYGVSKETWMTWHQQYDLIGCATCGNKDYDYNMLPVKTLSSDTVFLCGECLANLEDLGWCRRCNEAFIAKVGDKDKTLCYDCMEEYNDTNTGN